MKTVSQGFRDALRNVRQIRAVVSYEGDEGTYILTTETPEDLITEDSNFTIGTEREMINIKEDSILSANLHRETQFLKTICKVLTLNSTIYISEGKEIDFRIGVKVGNDYEYINYGHFYVYGKPEYQADTNSYVITAYDKMYEAMVSYDDDPLIDDRSEHYGYYAFIQMLCAKFNWNGDWLLDLIENNFSDLVYHEVPFYYGLGLTYRDILDDLCVVLGNFYFDESNVLKVAGYTYVQDDVEYEDLKSNNVKIGEGYGPITRITMTDANDLTYTIADNTPQGEEPIIFDIGNNYLMLNDEYADIYYLVGRWLGLGFNTVDFDSTGILTTDLCDLYFIKEEKDGNINYISSMMLNDTIKIDRGLTETVIADIPEANVENYVTTTPTTSDVKNAIIRVDKANGEIVLKADANGNIVKVALGADASTGTSFTVQADNISLIGYTEINSGLSVDNNGDVHITKGLLHLNNGTNNEAIWIHGTGSYYSYMYPNQIDCTDGTNSAVIEPDRFLVYVQNGAWTEITPVKVETPKVIAGNIDCGSCTLNSSGETTVYFNKTFSSTPKVVITPRTSTSGVIAPKIRSVGTGSFNAIIGGSGFSNIDCDWIAIG